MKSLAAEDRNGKSDPTPASSNGPLLSSAAVGSFTTASFNNANQVTTSGPAIFTPSTSVSTVVPSSTGDMTSATSSSSILGAAATPTIFGGPVFKFGGSSDPPAEVSVASTMIIPAGDLKTKAVKDLTADSVGTASQGSFVPPLSFTSVMSPPSSNTDTAPSSVPSLSSSQVFNSVMPFGFNSSASSSGAGAVLSGSGATSSIFGVNPTAVSDGSSASTTSVATTSMFSFGLSSSSSSTNAVGLTGGVSPPVFSFGSGSSVSDSATNTTSTFSTTAVASSGGAASPAFSFGASSSNSASVTNTFTNGSSGVFNFGGSSSASSSTIKSVISDPAPSNPFGSSWQTPKSSVFGSTPTSSSPATGFAFGVSAAAAPPSSPGFPFTASSASAQPVFGNSASGFAASPGNNYHMNGEDSMAEDPVQSTAPSVAIFGQPSVAPSPSGFMFGMAAPTPAPAQANPFQFSGQQNQVAPQNPPMFPTSGSLEFNAGGGSFSLGSGGGDKSGRKFVKVNRSKNRKK